MAISWNGTRVLEPTCGSCGSPNVMTIQLVYDDTPVSIRVCSECEQREWIRDGEPVGIDDIVPTRNISIRPRRRA